MQDLSNLARNLLLVGLVSLGAPVAGCTVVEDEDPDDVQLQADDDDVELDLDDDEVEIEGD